MRQKIIYGLIILFGLFIFSLIFFYPLGRLVGGTFSLSSAGALIAQYPGQLAEASAKRKGGYVLSADIPLCLRQGIISVEDKRFYSHSGIDPFAVIRVFFEQFKNDHQDHGGSTISQQLARAILAIPRLQPGPIPMLESEFSVMKGALILEHDFNKQKILELYLNSVYFGRGATGAGSAAQAYFGKNLSELDQAQCIYLAGLPQAPTLFGRDPESAYAQERYMHVLATMERNGFISHIVAETFRSEELFAP